VTPITVHRLGLVEYQDGLELQRRFQRARMAGAVDDALMLLSHPPVLTMGRGAKAFNILAPAAELSREGVAVHETDRGGDVTYHGPGQLVGYPLLHLGPGRQDVRKYVRGLEEVLIRTLAQWGIAAHREEKWPGVWVKQSRLGGLRKIAALGVHLSRWYTRHGVALNVAPKLSHFELIVPCGIKEAGVTTMAAELGTAPDLREVERAFAQRFGEVFEQEVRWAGEPIRTVSVVVKRAGRVLLLRRTPARGGFWQPVTGKIEPGESAAAAAKRELLEETGIRAEPRALEYVHSFVLAGEDGAAPVVAEETAFEVDVPSDEVKIDSNEHEAFEWVAPAVAVERVPYAGLKRIVR
jgi:lipoyl(octanoyl) transferase